MRDLLLQEIETPSAPHARRAVLGAALSGPDPLVVQLPWQQISETDAFFAAMRARPGEEARVLEEIAMLVARPEPSALVAAVALRATARPTSALHGALRAYATPLELAAQRAENPLMRRALRAAAQGE
jgi:hypothetical protein